jgi:hypothetical protein
MRRVLSQEAELKTGSKLINLTITIQYIKNLELTVIMVGQIKYIFRKLNLVPRVLTQLKRDSFR